MTLQVDPGCSSSATSYATAAVAAGIPAKVGSASAMPISASRAWMPGVRVWSTRCFSCRARSEWRCALRSVVRPPAERIEEIEQLDGAGETLKSLVDRYVHPRT